MRVHHGEFSDLFFVEFKYEYFLTLVIDAVWVGDSCDGEFPNLECLLYLKLVRIGIGIENFFYFSHGFECLTAFWAVTDGGRYFAWSWHTHDVVSLFFVFWVVAVTFVGESEANAYVLTAIVLKGSGSVDRLYRVVKSQHSAYHENNDAGSG